MKEEKCVSCIGFLVSWFLSVEYSFFDDFLKSFQAKSSVINGQNYSKNQLLNASMASKEEMKKVFALQSILLSKNDVLLLYKYTLNCISPTK